MLYPVVGAESVVVADDGLGGLGYGIVDHEDDGEEVAGYAECGYSVFLQVVDEDLVAHKHHTGDGDFAEERGGAETTHVAEVSCGEDEAVTAELYGVEA